MKFDIITIFPEIFSAKGGSAPGGNSYLNESILKRARKKKLIEIKIHDLRKFAKDKYRRPRRIRQLADLRGRVDDRPFGGGPGMVFKIGPLIKAVSSIKNQVSRKKTKIIIFSPGGRQFNNKMAAKLAKENERLILICGRYEGIDARLKNVLRASGFKIQELSVGPYVLTGGELPAMILIDAVSRQIPGVLGKQESIEEKRFGIGIPVYTRPEIFIYNGPSTRLRTSKKYRVPKVLLSGNHKKIDEWRKKFTGG